MAGISNYGNEISNWVRDYKLGQKGFQVGAGVTNRSRTNPLVNNLNEYEVTVKVFICLQEKESY